MNIIDITNITSGKDKREYVSALENVRNLKPSLLSKNIGK